MQPMVPLEGLASQVKGCDGEILVTGDSVIAEEMFDLKQPTEDILVGELGNFLLSRLCRHQ